MTSPSKACLLPIRLAVVAAAGLGLLAAGCADRRDAQAILPLETLAATSANTGWTALGPAAALVRLPDVWGRAQSVSERRLNDGVAQEIMLRSAPSLGRNHIAIAVSQNAGIANPGPGKPTEAGIRAELASAFPDRTMRVVGLPRHNAFGPYGLAVASGPGRERCVYAWQWLDRDDRRIAERLGGSASWRARICRSDATLDQIAADLDRIDVGLDAQRARELEPPQTKPRPVVRKARPAQTVARQPPAAEPIDTGSLLAPGGRRYLAPISGPANSGLAPRLPSAVEGSRTALDASLPAEAYRGPTAQPGQQTRLPLRDAAVLRSAVPTPD